MCSSWRRFSHEARLCQGREHRRGRGLRRDLDDRRETSRNPKRRPLADTSWMALASCGQFSHAGRLCQRVDGRQILLPGVVKRRTAHVGTLGTGISKSSPRTCRFGGTLGRLGRPFQTHAHRAGACAHGVAGVGNIRPKRPNVPDLRRAPAIPNTPNRGTARSAIEPQGPRLRGERVGNLRARTAL